MYLVFKKKSKQSDIFEKLISFFTRSDIIHTEIATVKRNDTFYGYTSEPFKGVTARWVKYDPKVYEFIEIDLDINKLKVFYNSTQYKKYDYLGVLGFVFGTPHDPNRYFCSEWCGTALGLEKPHKLSPKDLYKFFNLGE